MNLRHDRMRGIGLIWGRCGKPVREYADVLTRNTSYRWPHAELAHVDSSHLSILQNSYFRNSGKQNQGIEYKVCFHGLLLNRVEIAKSLNLHHACYEDCPDEQLVLSSYIKWGKDCVHRLRGEYSLAIWDGDKKEIFGARDAAGCKPFFYCENSEIFACASEPSQLVGVPTFRHDLNESALAAYATNQLVSTSDSLFSSINRLPAGHHITVKHSGVTIEKYFYYKPEGTIKYAREEEYKEHFIEILENSISARRNSTTSMGHSLSGGLDSSLIVGKTEQLAHQGKISSGSDGIYSLIFPDLISCDESRHIETVANSLNLKVHRVAPELAQYGDYEMQTRESCNWTPHPHRAMLSEIARRAKANSIDTLVTGFGSDELFNGSLYWLADCIRSFNFKGMLDTRKRFGIPERKSASRYYRRYVLKPLLPDALLAAFWHLRPFKSQTTIQTLYGERTLNHIAEPSYISSKVAGQRFTDLSQCSIVRTLESAWLKQALEQTERVYARFGISETHPFLDREMIEFALAIPEDMRWQRDKNKYVLRLASAGITPVEILERQEKTTFEELQLQSLFKVADELDISNMVACKEGWLEPDVISEKMRLMLQKYRTNDPSYESDVWPMWCALSLELVLREVLPVGH